MKKKQKRKKEPFCKNCLLYDFHKKHCKVVVLYEGEKINPPTSPNDYCIFEQPYQSTNDKGEKEIWKPEVEQIKWWCENPNTGEKSDRGIVKMEYPENLFMEIPDEEID